MRVEMPLRGAALLAHSLYNKGTAFSREERSAFGLEGLLPDAVSTPELQAERIYGGICRKQDPLERYIGMAALLDRNEHLFYRVLSAHLEELLPVVYTPTVGEASRRYSHIHRRGRGVWITPRHRGRIAEVLERAAAGARVRLIVATDNQAILGIGDQGAGGIVIPIGKLAIYCAAAGIHPGETLPVSLDVGTDNRELLDDELYLGWREPRLTGDSYLALVEELVEAVAGLFPGALLQWEDFRKENAFTLLERFRDRLPSFNDDIQGTGAVALAGLLAAMRRLDRELAGCRVLILGAGAAGIGVARQVSNALRLAGVEGEELTASVAVLDSRGLLVDARDHLEAYKRPFAWPAELARRHGLEGVDGLAAAVGAFAPDVLIGTSGQAGAFSREVVRALAGAVERPVILPFSNPTAQSEGVPEDLLRWSDGRALVATGSPFPPVEIGGRTVHVGQGNNALVFPAVGLGALVAGATRVSSDLLTAAAHALAGEVREEELARGQLYPSMSRLREVTREVAAAVVRRAVEEGCGEEIAADEVPARLRAAMWEPVYPELVPV